MKINKAPVYFCMALACVVNAMASTRIERDISVDSGNITSAAAAAVAPESIIRTQGVTGAAAIKNVNVLKKHLVHVNVNQKVLAQNAAKEEAHKHYNGARKAEDKAYVPTAVHPTHGLRTVGSNKPRRNQLDMAHPIEAYTAVYQISAPHANLYQRLMSRYPNAIQGNVLDPITSSLIPPKVEEAEYLIHRHSAGRHVNIPNVERYAPAEYSLKPQLSVKEFDGANTIFRFDPAQNSKGAAVETERDNNNYLPQKFMGERMQKEKYSSAGVLNAIKKHDDLDRKHMQLRRKVLDAPRIINSDDKVQDFKKKLMQQKLDKLEKEELAFFAHQLAIMIEKQVGSDKILRSLLRVEQNDKHVRRPPAAEKDYEGIVDAVNSDEDHDEVAQNFMDTGENMEQLMN